MPERIASSALAALCCALAWPASATAQDGESWRAWGQATYVWQSKDPFRAAYSGPHSLSPAREKSYSFTATAGLGLRPWAGGELYADVEAAQGVPLSGLTGLGGFTNGEIARTAGPTLTAYRARLFVRHTWGVGGGSEAIEADADQLAGTVDRRRWVLTVGNLSVLDLFDDNAYSHDPRTQFLNWSLMTHGAFDYAADARGYSWGVALAWHHDAWALRFGRFLQPREPNLQSLDPRIFRHYGDQIELEHAHALGGFPGKVRVLAFHNRAVMSSYQDALAQAAAAGGAPSLDAVRFGERNKVGAGIAFEQALGRGFGLFGRASWADGKTETYAFTEIDRSVSLGALLEGAAWGRAADALGFAAARNELSGAHRAFLAAGGIGFFLGDGRLEYRPETVLEAFYRLALTGALALSLDWQRIRNPGYNAARGPANVVSLRLHTEF